MKTGLAIWHYPQRTLPQNAAFFLANGFDSVSVLGQDFLKMLGSDADSETLCATLKTHKAPLTVHHRLPDPDNPALCDAFFDQIDQIATWQRRFGQIDILSFDTWFDRIRLHPYLLYAVKKFRGLGCRIACEDYPLNDEELACLQGLEKEPHVGMLLDLGHLNIRLTAAGPDEPQTAREALAALPLPILEIHVHSNDGKKDQHHFIHHRQDLLVSWVRELKGIGFDGIVTIESVPPWQGLSGDDGDAAILSDLAAWTKSWSTP